MADTAQATEEQTEGQQAPDGGEPQEDSKMQAQSVELSEAQATENIGAGTSIDILLDMNIPVTVAIGKMQIPVQRLLQIGPGSVLKLNKPVDAPVDLYLKDTKFATGSIVVIDNRFAVRIKEITSTNVASSTTEG